MSISRKKTIIGIGIILLIVVIGIFVSNYFIRHKIESQFKNLPRHLKLSYDNISVNSLLGNIDVEKLTLQIFGKTTKQRNTFLQLKTLSIKDIDYWDLLINDLIDIESITIDNAHISYTYNPLVEQESYRDNIMGELKESIAIGTFQINITEIFINQFEEDSLILKMKNFNFAIAS